MDVRDYSPVKNMDVYAARHLLCLQSSIMALQLIVFLKQHVVFGISTPSQRSRQSSVSVLAIDVG